MCTAPVQNPAVGHRERKTYGPSSEVDWLITFNAHSALEGRIRTRVIEPNSKVVFMHTLHVISVLVKMAKKLSWMNR